MRRVHLSFLGLGSYDPITKKHDYKPAIYKIDRKEPSDRTKFVQVAEAQILQETGFDIFIVVATQASHDLHRADLEEALRERGVQNIEWIIIEETMTAEGQWKWFEEILRRIEIGDELTVDLTHGYRSTPIIFSTAVNFLQKSRKVTLRAAYYGVFEKRDENDITPIVDMKDFFVINEWAEAVSRLVEDADMRKLAAVASDLPYFQSGGLNDPDLVKALNELTTAIRNVEVNAVATKAKRALELVEIRRRKTTETGRALLDLVVDKFACIAADEPTAYNEDFFRLQLEIVHILLEHKLFMQAYAVMRELIGSIGMILLQKKNRLNSQERGRRTRYSSVFVNMLQIDESEWRFEGDEKILQKKLEPTYEALKKAGVIQVLRGFAKVLVDYRNGFDHAWTSKSAAYTDIEKKGADMLEELRKAVALLKESGFLTS